MYQTNPCEKMNLQHVIYHQGAYDMVREVADEQISNWNMHEFEQYAVYGELPHNMRDEDICILMKCVSEIDQRVPFLPFRTPGQHYAYELFLSPPPHWGSRGAPFFWAYAARAFTYDKLPLDETCLKDKYLAIVQQFGIPFGKDEYVYIPLFAHGGMSSGAVGGLFAEESLNTLLRRLKYYL